MTRYETLMLIRPNASGDDLPALQEHIEQLISKSSGKLISYDSWGKYKLSYPVRKNSYGLYFLVRFEIPANSSSIFLEELNSYFKIKAHDLVMRSLTKRLKTGATLLYQKPQPIDDVKEGRFASSQFKKDF